MITPSPGSRIAIQVPNPPEAIRDAFDPLEESYELNGLRVWFYREIPLPHQSTALPNYIEVSTPPRLFQVGVTSGISARSMERERLLFIGDRHSSKSLDQIAEVLGDMEADEASGVFPQPLDHWHLHGAAFLLTNDHLTTFDDFTSTATWRSQSLRETVNMLAHITRALQNLHRAGYALGSLRPEQLVLGPGGRVALAHPGQLVALRGLSHVQTQEMIRRDIRAIGVLLLEVATRSDVSSLLQNFHKVLDDAQFLLDTGIARPGLAQVLLGSLTLEPPFAYQDIHELLYGLLQLKTELSPALYYDTGMASTVGNFPLRRTDQDSCGIAENRVIYHGELRHLGFYCVADGVGGEEHGERASQHAVQSALLSFHKACARYPFQTLSNSPSPVARSIVKVAAQELAILGEDDPDRHRGATTFTGMMIVGDRAGLGHLGDSRAYLYRAGKLTLLTRDHNVANMKAALTQLTGKELDASDDDQRRISRFLGTMNETPLDWIDSFRPGLVGDFVQARRNLLDESFSGQMTIPPTERLTMEAIPSLSLANLPQKAPRRHNASTSPQTRESRTGEDRRVFDNTTEQEARESYLTLEPGDQILLMTDGLYGEISEDAMIGVLSGNESAERCARTLVQEALRGIAMDNITALVIRVLKAKPNV